ncbi:hypothetical protein ACIBI9_67295, partial [Nonomuraea sp. NPDC050451]|uniref:hypothetical protein n=1 Tax=Nonomuraea sp. NPDC050451 TaxID=3364364 RepID=UPI0037ABF0A7
PQAEHDLNHHEGQAMHGCSRRHLVSGQRGRHHRHRRHHAGGHPRDLLLRAVAEADVERLVLNLHRGPLRTAV